MNEYLCYLLGEHAIVLALTNTNPSTNEQRRLFALTAQLIEINAFFDVVPAKSSVTVYLKDPTEYQFWLIQIETFWKACEAVSFQPTTHRLNVHYGKHFGPDLKTVANTLERSESQIIELHTSTSYQVEFIGFLPGFAYLGTLHTQLHLPRKVNPRSQVPKGSVAIAQELTAVYPCMSPGGWHLLGLCDTALFDPQAQRPSLLMPGDRVEFKPTKEGLC